MKTITQYARLVIIVVAVLTTCIGFGQQTNEKPVQQKYHIKIMQDVNGKDVVVEKTFDTKAELDAYINANKVDIPEVPDETDAQASDNATNKKICIEEVFENGRQTAHVTYYNFTAAEIKQVEQNVLAQKAQGVSVEVRKECKMSCPGGNSTCLQQRDQPPPAAVNSMGNTVNNLTDVKVFPNPARGQFSLKFSVAKAVNVTIKVSDLNGREVYTEALVNCNGVIEKEITNKNITAGTYIVTVDAGSERETTTVVMQ